MARVSSDAQLEVDHAQDLGEAVVELAGDAVALGVDRPLLLGLVEAGGADGDRGHVREGAEEAALLARERTAGADDAQLAQDPVRAAERPGHPGASPRPGSAAGSAGSAGGRRRLLVGDQARRAVVRHRQALAAGRPAARRSVARVGQAGDRALGAEQVAGVAG